MSLHRITIILIVMMTLLSCGYAGVNNQPTTPPFVIPTLPALDKVHPMSQPPPLTTNTVSGTIQLEGRDQHKDIAIYQTYPGCSDSSANRSTTYYTTDDGHFNLSATILSTDFVPPLITNSYASCLVAIYPGYLTVEYFPITQTTLHLTMRPGDVNNDGVINMVDVAFVSQHLNSNNPVADFNQNGQVDITDVTVVINNFTQ